MAPFARRFTSRIVFQVCFVSVMVVGSDVSTNSLRSR